MKAQFVGHCLFCTPCFKAIKIGDEIVRHPNVPFGENDKPNWVHAYHVKKVVVAPAAQQPVQLKLFK